jgi:hypothetical protein
MKTSAEQRGRKITSSIIINIYICMRIKSMWLGNNNNKNHGSPV